jgi:putative PIN family toxin of toxin-antitoxin system
MRRIVFDTSTLVSALLRPHSTPDRAFTLAHQVGLICACESTLHELHDVLCRKKFDRYLAISHRLAFLATLRRYAWMVPQSAVEAVIVEPSCRDAKDNLFLALALASNAEAIVSGDGDLLVLNPWNGILILKPSDFLSWYDLQ